ncbi:MAG: hypothetical protein F4Y02_08890 [Chloroflexi bacterium]|nr:hypothetical protein [Chloroflexota bacterium]
MFFFFSPPPPPPPPSPPGGRGGAPPPPPPRAGGRINRTYRRYARQLKFHIDPCAPRQPQAKSKDSFCNSPVLL